jgi:hypothetical protein
MGSKAEELHAELSAYRVIGFRRGGPVEIVDRRLKFVANPLRSDAQTASVSAVAESVAPESACDNTAIQSEQPDPIELTAADIIDVSTYVPPQAPAAKPARVLIAPAVQRPVERGMADASLIAHIPVRKWDGKAWYEGRKCYAAGHKKKAAVAVMRKLAKALWHVARGSTFDPAKLYDLRRLKLDAVELNNTNSSDVAA